MTDFKAGEQKMIDTEPPEREKMITFKIGKHNLTGRAMIDIFQDGRFVAAIYDDDSQPGVLKFISSHLDHVQVNSGAKLRVTGIPIIRFFFMDE